MNPLKFASLKSKHPSLKKIVDDELHLQHLNAKSSKVSQCKMSKHFEDDNNVIHVIITLNLFIKQLLHTHVEYICNDVFFESIQ